MYLYYLKEGDCASDSSDTQVASDTLFTDADLSKFFLECKKEDHVQNIWSFSSWLVKNRGFYWPTFEAGIDLENYKDY